MMHLAREMMRAVGIAAPEEMAGSRLPGDATGLPSLLWHPFGVFVAERVKQELQLSGV
jgi:hypothetical protein